MRNRYMKIMGWKWVKMKIQRTNCCRTNIQGKEFGDLEVLWKSDSKYLRLKKMIQTYLKQNLLKKLYSFPISELHQAICMKGLLENGISSIILMGGIDQSKDAVLEKFSEHGGPNIPVVIGSG